LITTIKLDYDQITTRDIQLIFHHRGWLIKYYGIVSKEAYQTTHGYHILIKVEADLDPRDVLLLQILMGSDIQRDIYNFIRHTNGEGLKDWSRLYTKKYILLRTRHNDDTIFKSEVLSSEKECPELLGKVTYELENATDWRGRI